MYKKFLSPILFLFDPEFIHNVTFRIIKLLFKIPLFAFFVEKFYKLNHPSLKTKILGLDFPNPVGMAAGFDKNATHINEFEKFGFGFIEVGTITPEPQKGNPKKRLFRLKDDSAIINRMGFNNDGLKTIKARLTNKKSIIVGGNIGKNKNTLNKDAKKDYLTCFKELYDILDYFVINVSSPNTIGLRELQSKFFLNDLFKDINSFRNSNKISKPVLLKISPDLTKKKVDEILNVISKNNIDGIIATNTTIDNHKLKSKSKYEKGGISGVPLFEKSNSMISYISKKTMGKLPIIGVGGIQSPDDAIKKIRAGACLVQLYTGIIYEGPGLIKKINKKLVSI